MKKIILSILIICFSLSIYAEKEKVAKESIDAPSAEEITFEQIKLSRLKRLWKELVTTKHEINTVKEKLTNDQDMVSRLQLESDLAKLQKQYDSSQFLFIETVTGVNLAPEPKAAAKTDLTEDIKQILEPVLSTFKKIADRPRQVQALNEELSFVKQRYEDAQKAQKKLEKFLQDNEHKEFKWKLRESIQETKQLVGELKVRQEDLQYKIINLDKTEESIVTTFSSLIFEFIKTKGKNLVLAILVFIIVYWLFRIGRNRFIGLVMFRMHKSDNREVYQWIVRPLRVLYSVISTVVAFFLSILTLYVLNDWVLVTLILIVLVALVWSSKQYLPLFFEQSKIILNLGMVREGERVMLYGLPWVIKTLGYYCHLQNPALSGGSIKVSTKELLHSNSRRVNSNEFWFPTSEGDWVEGDNFYGRVILQTPEEVIVRLIGGENIHFKTSEFYSLGLKNLSRGFAIEFEFGLDYSLQQKMFDEVLPTFKSKVKEVLLEKHSDLADNLHEFNIDFLRAGASSLDLRLFVKLDGNLAHMKKVLERSIQAEFVKVCNEHDYIIPFNQLTVHMQK